MEERLCDYCRDPIDGEGIQRGNALYCCEACAFEASRSQDCGGRGDSTIAQPVVDTTER